MRLLCAVDATALAEWIASIPFDEWPQQKPLGDGQLRPAMVTDVHWHGFGEVAAPVVEALLRHYPDCRTQQWMLSVVMPGHQIDAHRDEQPPYWRTRVHVPLQTNKQAWFCVEGTPHWLGPCFAYEIDTRRVHEVINSGGTPRIHFMFDVVR